MDAQIQFQWHWEKLGMQVRLNSLQAPLQVWSMLPFHLRSVA